MPGPTKCPRCGKTLRAKPGTKRTTPGNELRFQYPACLLTHPEACEWHPGIVAMLNDMKANGEVLTEENLG